MTAFIARAGHFMLAFAPSSHPFAPEASGGSKADLRVASPRTHSLRLAIRFLAYFSKRILGVG